VSPPSARRRHAIGGIPKVPFFPTRFFIGGDTMSSHRSGRNRRPLQSRAVLRLKELESRWCPSCVVTQTGNTLSIIGDAGNNTVGIVDNGAAGIVVTCDGDTHPAATGIERVRVDTGAGDDTVTYSRSAAGGNFTGPLDFSAKLGNGNDTLTANFNGNSLAGTARVKFNIEGNAGNDTITFNAGATPAPANTAPPPPPDLPADRP